MRVASSEFADDPCSSVKRGTMVRAARALLSAVTRLLILADMADVMRLLAHLKIVSAVNTQPGILLGYVVMELYLELQHFKYIYICVKNTDSPNLYVVVRLVCRVCLKKVSKQKDFLLVYSPCSQCRLL